MTVRILALVIAALFAVPSFGFTQASGTGSVTGRVADSSGAVLPGVSVTLKSPEALGQFTALTDADGLYRVNNLPPATYEVRAELQGFQSAVQKLTVRLATTAVADFALAVGSMTETVNVSGEASTVDPERAGLAVNINNAALTSLPVSTQRRYQDIWALVPGVFVRPDQADINPSVNSRGTSENSTKLDGMDITDPFGGGGFAASFNYDAIQDIQIKTLGAEAEDGGRTGGFMTIVTKSGSNTLHGSGALFVIPDAFNSSNVTGVSANQRKDLQPDLTLGGPIMRDRAWFFGAYRRVQEDQTLNNAPVARERRGNQIYGKVTTQLHRDHRLTASMQYDKTRARHALIRSSAIGATSASGGLSSATAQQVSPTAFGDQVTGGPLFGTNYTWVVRSNQVFQFIGSWMVNKPQNAEPSGDFGVTRVIQTNSANNIAGSLTTIAQEGSLGVVDRSDRSMLYLYPSYSFAVSRWGSHDFKVGAELYPFLRNKTSRDISPLEFYYRPPGTTGSADVLFERDTFRTNGSGTKVSNQARENIYGIYLQDRWKPRSNLSIKAGFRIDSNRIYTKDRQKVLGAVLPAGFPTATADQEFNQTTFAPNAGVAWNTGRWGVIRGTAGRYYEWLDLGGGDGTSHAPYVVATDIARASPRTNAPLLNQELPGAFPLGVNYGFDNKKTYTNEFSAGWERQLPKASSVGVTFLLKRTLDFQGADDQNVTRNPLTGAFLGRPFPDFDAVLRTYAPNYSIQQFRSVQLLYTKNFAQRWGINANYWYAFHQSIVQAFNPTRDTLQFLGFSEDDLTNNWVSPRHQSRISSFVRLPFGTMVSGFYSMTQGPRSDVLTGDFPLNATAPRIILSNGRSVADPFYNPAYPRARRRGIDMLAADTVHLVNMRLQKTFALGDAKKLEISGDVFNLFNSDAAFGFLSSDSRSASFGVRTSIVQPRVGQLGVRYVF
ncbi:MAG: TonB-dependent receptor [Vicinamibacterales bacterium]